MAKDLADLVVSLELQSAKYQAGLDSATKKLQKFHSDTTDALTGIKTAFAEILSADLLFEFAKSTLEASANLAEFSKSTGVAVESLSALQFAAKAGGVGTDELNTALKKLNVSASEAAGDSTSRAALAFQLLGISVKDAGGNIKSADVLFAEVADKFQSTADGANKVQLAVALFGKAGDALIPTLDKGSAGLKELGDQGRAAGAIIDKETAEAALKFREKAELLRATLVDGLGAQIEKQLLPNLNALSDEFITTGKAAEALKPIADLLVGAFKIVSAIIIEAGSEIKQVVDSFTALGNVSSAVLKGHLGEAVKLWKDSNKQNEDTAAASQKAIALLFAKGGDDVLSEIKITAKKIPEALGSLSGAEAAQAALKQLQAFADGLQAEALKLDQGSVAATKYKLAHGELAKALTLTGAAGQKLATKAITAATEIETDAIGKQLEGLKSQLKSLSGDTVGAGLDSFNRSVDTLEKQLKDVGGTTQQTGQKIIDNLKQATQFTLEFNKAQTDTSRIQQDFGIQQQQINDQADAGFITRSEQSEKLRNLSLQEAAALKGIVDQQNAIAAASGNPALEQQAKAATAAVQHLAATIDPITKQIRDDFESAFADNFEKLITGAESLKQALQGFFKDILTDLAKIASKNIAESIFGGSGGNAGAGSGLVSIVSSLFGGAHADGGVIPTGKVGLVGEEGPELVMGGAGGTNVIPNGQFGGTTQHNSFNFVIQSQNGQISRQSQTQVAAAAARALGAANQRNNR